MSQYAYAACPGGKDKKIKFCCPDLVGELEKIDRMLRGEQFVACLEQLERLDQRYPNRACVLTVKAMLERNLGLSAQAQETLKPLAETQSDNPVVLAEQALLVLEQGNLSAALDLVQRALSVAPWPLPPRLRAPIGAIAEHLVGGGHFIAARAYLRLLAASDNKDRAVLTNYFRLQSAAIGVLNKLDLDLLPSPAGVPWEAEHNVAVARAEHGAWREAERVLTRLADAYPDTPVLLANLALLRVLICNESGAVPVYRRLASLDLPLDQRIEAEAVAQHFDSAQSDDRADEVVVRYTLNDIEAAMARLLASPRSRQLPISPEAAEEGEPPPRFGFQLFDRPRVAEGTEPTPDSLPTVVGEVLLYGRQTDREARLEFYTHRDDVLPATQAFLAECCGDSLGAVSEEEVLGEDLLLTHALQLAFVLPDGLSADAADALRVGRRRWAILERLPALRLKLLEGRTVAEAAADPRLRVRAMGLLLRVELGGATVDIADDCDQLRSRLGLPAPEPADLGDRSPLTVPLLELRRLRPADLADEDLLRGFMRTANSQWTAPAYRFAQAIVERPGEAMAEPRLETYRHLAELAPTTAEALSWLDRGRDEATSQRMSTAPFDLLEVRIRVQRMEPEHVSRLLSHLLDEHGKEPGVRQAVAQILLDLGLIRPDGTPVGAPDEAAVAAAAAPEPGKLWTPESQAPAGQKSGLWLPGME